ncbi:TOM1-like protein 6 isoform X1 [Zingiber officinale]|uniref:TOM1-like protein 2 n=2 Tax=Zingiber officinale TaxID=94328 RepID=A0A8J5HWR0_ZINOF|nr:TOM1-like protein 6 isoform X1 [Zingiber officinale]KAG6537232.1 hypothetical protein ZIOFF_002318 [Zingiber officinale]
MSLSLSLSSSSAAAVATVGVDKATSDLLMGPDWTLNIEICDSINCNRWPAKDVVKAVKKRLQHKNPKVQFLALTLLEMMIKNCGDYLHFQVVEREILQEMLKIVRKKADLQVRDKILELIDSWQEAFGGSGGKYPQFYWAYTDLRRSGVIFPKRSPDATLTLTPPENATPSVRYPQIAYGTSNGSGSRLDEAMMSEMATLSLADLSGMKTVTDLFSEMLKAVDLNDRNAVEDEVIKDLVHQCHANQKKLVESINSISDADDVLLAQALELNDNLQSLFVKYDALASGLPVPAQVSESTPSSLPVVAPQHSTTRQYNNDDNEEDDDDFAQLARRTLKMKPDVAHGKSTAPSGQSTLFNQSNNMLSTGASSVEGGASYMLGSNSLALPDPPAPIKISSKDQDMVDLFSLTLLSNPLPSHTSLPSIQYDEIKPPTSVQPTDSEPFYAPENSYVASWARKQAPTCPPQSHLQPELFDNSSAYPPPPWATSPDNVNANNPFAYNPFLSTTYQSHPLGVGAAAGYTSLHDSRLVQHFNGDGSRVHNAPATGQPMDHRPYVYTSRLFSELLSKRNSSPGLGDTGSSASETPRGGTHNERK